MTWRRLLLDRPRVGALAPEQALQASVADRLRSWVLSGELRAVFTAVPHELPLPRGLGAAHMAASIGAKRKAMGCIAGASDFVLTWSGGSGWLELKRPAGEALAVAAGRIVKRKVAAGRLSETQEWFRDWCAASGVAWALIQHLEEIQPTLLAWGCLTAPPTTAAHPDRSLETSR